MGQVLSWIEDNLAEDERQGEAREENAPQSLFGMIYTLIPMLILAIIYLIIFFFTRSSQKRFYAPRSYLGSLPEHERTPQLPDTWFSWIPVFWSIPDAYALQHQSLDAYLFLRYLRICTIICTVSMCLTWPILFPLHATGGNGKSQLEMVSYSNLDIEKNAHRLYAHALLAWVVYGFVMYMITRECIFYINLRQVFLLTPQAAKRISSRTVLFSSVPEEYLDEAHLRHVFGDSLKSVWINGDVMELQKLIKKRDKVCMLLEQGEVELIKKANRKRLKELKRAPVPSQNSLIDSDLETATASSSAVDEKMRPSHRLGFLGLFGQKVDTLEWCRRELLTLLPEAEEAQARWRAGDFTKSAAVFAEFHTQHQAQIAYQVLTHHHGLSMSPKHIGVRPDEIIWENLAIPWWQLIIRQYIMYSFVATLIIFWAIPVAVVGIVAQISVLQSLPFLTWINQIPSEILGIVAGLLPSAVLAILMSFVPIIMQFAAKLAGAASQSEVELFTQNAFFLFQLIQVFLIRTITDTASSAIVQIVKSPTLVFSTLAEALPTSSNFYISYFIIEGVMIAIDVMTQVVGCVVFKVWYRLFAREPRTMYKAWSTLSSISWGSVLPIYTGIVIISITYAVIAPILLFWSSLGIGIFYQAYRYNILFVSDTKVDTRGLIYPRALKQLFAGVYLAEICLVGMFVVSKAPGQAAIVIILLVFTVLYQITLGRALNPLLYNLPSTLQAEEERHQRHEAERYRDEEAGHSFEKSTVEKKLSSRGNSFPSRKDIRFNKDGNFLVQFLKPWVYADYWTLRKLVPHEENFRIPHQARSDDDDQDEEHSPYWPPCVTSPTPLLWIPRDPGGVSKREIEETSKVIGITDEDCVLDDKNKIQWDTERARPPIWEEKAYY